MDWVGLLFEPTTSALVIPKIGSYPSCEPSMLSATIFVSESTFSQLQYSLEEIFSSAFPMCDAALCYTATTATAALVLSFFSVIYNNYHCSCDDCDKTYCH